MDNFNKYKDKGELLHDATINVNRTIKAISNENEEYKDIELLQLIEFSSDRKRETVIVKDGSLIKLYIKGEVNYEKISMWNCAMVVNHYS